MSNQEEQAATGGRPAGEPHLFPLAREIAAEMGRRIGRGLEVMVTELAKLPGRTEP